MSNDTRAYFDAMQEFDWAMSERKFSQALVALKTGLRQSQRALLSMKKERGSIPRSVPFIGTKAGALAAIMNDAETFTLMDEVAAFIGEDNPEQVQKFKDDAVAIAQVRTVLQTQQEVSLDELKAVVDSDVRSRLLRLIAWMEKNSELSVEKSGKTSIIKAGAAPRQASIVASTFREGLPLANPLTRPLPPLHRDRPKPESKGALSIVELPEKGTPLAPADRLPGAMQTYPLQDGFWLLGHPRTLPNGAGETKVMVKSKTGETLSHFVLRHRVVRAFSSFRREHIIILDSTLTVVVFDLMGNYIKEIALGKNPEVRSVLDTLDDSTKPTAVLRAVDVSPVSGDIAFSVLDYVWRFTSAGEPVSAFHIPVGDPWESTDAVALQTGSELAIIELGHVGWERDWIYFVRFSERDDSLFVSTYAGNLLRVPSHGEFESHWDVFSSANDILERDDDMIVSTWSGTSFIDASGVAEHYPEQDGVFFSDNQLVDRTDLFNPITRKGVEYTTESDVRGIYPVDDKLRIEMKTTYCDVKFP